MTLFKQIIINLITQIVVNRTKFQQSDHFLFLLLCISACIFSLSKTYIYMYVYRFPELGLQYGCKKQNKPKNPLKS